MTLNRRDALATLKTKLEEISEVKTVVRSYMEIDITNYKTADLPLINIIEPAEEAEEQMTSMRAIMELLVRLKVWFVDWAEDPDVTIYETLIKKIRDKIGANFKLDNTVTGVWVLDVSLVDGELPVYNIEIGLAMKYYLSQQDN